MSASTLSNLPPLYFARLRRLKTHAAKVLGFVWLVVLCGTGVYLTQPIGIFIPIAWAVALWLSWAFWTGFRCAKRTRVIAYFRKGELRVEGSTFCSGEALSREWIIIERAAHELKVEPLSAFGLEDENEVRPFEWHDAKRGLASVAALLSSSQLSGEVREELALIEFRLRDASEKEVPFRLLLMGDHGMSGAEADVRHGHF